MILINIGDELLIGQVVNTNAAFIGQQMTAAAVPAVDADNIPEMDPDAEDHDEA